MKDKLHYRTQVPSNTSKKNVEQISNIRSNIYLSNDTNSEERNTERYKRVNTDVKKR